MIQFQIGATMASVVRRKRRNGSSSWYARYRDGRGKDVWEHCPTATDARARAAEVELELLRSARTWSRPAKVTFGEYAEQWLETHGRTIRPRTLAGYRRIFAYDLLPRFGHLQLTAITRGQVKALLNERAAGGAAANTLRNILAPMRAMLAAALDDELIRTNPAAGIRRTGRQAKRVEPPPPVCVRAVINAASGRGRLPILLAATAGLRRGEVFALRWADVDFDARTIRVHASNHGAGLITETKTAAGERLVPMFGSLRPALLEHKAGARFKQPQDLLFCTAAGTPESPNGWLKREFYPALERAGVEHFRFHDLRHFAVSQLIAQGANILQLARVAGHADPSITLKVYSHLMADGLAEAATRFDPLRPSAGLPHPVSVDRW